MHRTRDMGEGNHSRQWNCLLAQQTNLKNDICGYLNKKSNGKLGRINTKSPPIENRLNDTKRLYLESTELKQFKYDGGNSFVLDCVYLLNGSANHAIVFLQQRD
eukprot:369197_1